MPTQEIPRGEWPTFLDRFSRQHEGWLATLEVLAIDIGAQEQARDLPFEGITATSRDSTPETIAISLGKTASPLASGLTKHQRERTQPLKSSRRTK